MPLRSSKGVLLILSFICVTGSLLKWDAGQSLPVPDLHAELALCPITPYRSSAYTNCCGVYASSSASVRELLDAFPRSWEGRPISGIGLSVRPPGLAFRFERPMRLYLVFTYPVGLFSFDPPEIGHTVVTVDSVFVTWDSFPPHESSYGTSFGSWELFFLEPVDTSQVTITATVNLTATYAVPEDTIRVWGTEIGMPDIELRLSGLATPTAVEPATWGQIKALGFHGAPSP